METIHQLLEKINQNRQRVYDWLSAQEQANELPLYSSVDIRDAGFKVAVVDTNLFPAGFNNLCEHGLEDSVLEIRHAILSRVPKGKNILILAEEHTRNTWYLENVRILRNIIEKAGFNVMVATFLEVVEPQVCCDPNYVELETATGYPLRVYSLNRVVKDIQSGFMSLDLIIMNNDLTKGIPDILRKAKIPIYPSINAGWHSRLKSWHFKHTADLTAEFGRMLQVDPWLFSSLNTVVKDVDIQDPASRDRMANAASGLLTAIGEKYKEHHIQEKPFVFVKADSGTYGMGVMAFENAEEIRNMNKHGRKNLNKGKGSQEIHRFLIQEGVATRYRIDDQVGEVCIYQIANRLVGGFYRTNSEKSGRENLNSKGMGFKKMCPHLNKYGHCGVPTEANVFDLYRILARIAGIAAHREIIQLDAKAARELGLEKGLI